MNSQLKLSVSPHIHSGRSTQRIMLDVLIALLPTTVASIVLFRLKALWLILTCCLTALISCRGRAIRRA